MGVDTVAVYSPFEECASNNTRGLRAITGGLTVSVPPLRAGLSAALPGVVLLVNPPRYES